MFVISQNFCQVPMMWDKCKRRAEGQNLAGSAGSLLARGPVPLVHLASLGV